MFVGCEVNDTDKPTITPAELIAIQRIGARQRVQHGKVSIELVYTNGELRELFVKSEDRVSVKSR